MTSAELLTIFNRLHEQRFDKPAPIVPIADPRTATHLLRAYPAEMIVERMKGFFESDDALTIRSGYTFAVFAACMARLFPVHGLRLPKLSIDQQYLVKRMLAAMRTAMAG